MTDVKGHDRSSSSNSDRDVEKTTDAGLHVENLEAEPALTLENDPRILQFDHAQQRKIIHKVDRRLLITLGALYCVSLMDRTNLAAANIAGYVYFMHMNNLPRLHHVRC